MEMAEARRAKERSSNGQDGWILREAPPYKLGRLGKRCKLPQWCPEQIPGGLTI